MIHFLGEARVFHILAFVLASSAPRRFQMPFLRFFTATAAGHAQAVEDGVPDAHGLLLVVTI